MEHTGPEQMSQQQPNGSEQEGGQIGDPTRPISAESVDLFHANAGDIKADRIAVEQSSASSITGDHVRVDKSAVRHLEMNTGTVTQSAALNLTATDMAMHESAAASITSNRVDVFDSRVGIIRGPVTVQDGAVQVFLHIGQSDCSVKPVLSGESALKLGAGIGVSMVLINRLLRRILG